MSSTTSSPTPSASMDAANTMRFGIIDYVVFTLMLSTSALIGIYFGFFSKAKNTTEEYLRGGKKMQILPIAISLVARYVVAITVQ